MSRFPNFFLDDFWKNIKSGVSNWWKSSTGQALSNAQVEANQFSADEAQKNREFQQQMSDTAYQREVADMQAAGLNPQLMYRGSASGASTPSGASPTSVDPGQSSLNPLGLLAQIQQLSLLKAQRNSIKADTELKKAESKGKVIENQIRQKELEFTPARLAAQIDELLSNVNKNSEQAKQFAAQRDFLEKQTIRYDEVTDAQIAKDYSVVGLNDAQKEVAYATYQKILVENAWLPRMMSAQIANNLAAAGLSKKQASMMKFSLIKTVTLKDAQSMGVNIWKFGLNESSSKDTMVMICPDDNGKWEIVGLSTSDIKKYEPADVSDLSSVQELYKSGQ